MNFIPKAVLFDWDGTLADTTGTILDAHNHVRTHYGLDLWGYHDIFGKVSESARTAYPKIYGDDMQDALAMLESYMEENHIARAKLLPGARGLIEYIRYDLQRPIGVVSNRPHKYLLREITHFGWEEMIASAIGAGHAAEDKPSSVPLLQAMGEISPNLTPEDVLYIGDSETDLLTAQNAGVRCIYIHHGAPQDNLVKQYQPFLLVSTLEEIKTYLLGL